MTTTDHTILIILTSLLSLFFLLGIVVIIIIIKLLNSVRNVVAKADHVVDSVENAAEVFKNASGKLAVVRLVKNIVDLAHRKK